MFNCLSKSTQGILIHKVSILCNNLNGAILVIWSKLVVITFLTNYVIFFSKVVSMYIGYDINHVTISNHN